MKVMTVFAIIIGVLALVSVIYLAVMLTNGSRIEKKLVSLLGNRQFKEFEELADRPETERYVRPYNLDVLRLNEAMMKKDAKLIDKAFAHFDEVRLNSEQKEAVYSQAFDYYLATGDKKKTRKYHKAIMEMNPKDPSLKNSIDRMYDIYAKDGYRYLEDTLEELEQVNEDAVPILEGMIASMYKNKGDQEKYQEYKSASEKHFRELSEKQ